MCVCVCVCVCAFIIMEYLGDVLYQISMVHSTIFVYILAPAEKSSTELQPKKGKVQICSITCIPVRNS